MTTTPHRRTLLALPAGLAALAALPGAPRAQGAPTDPAGAAERAVGQAGAPVTVIEYFSMTCSHCATFHRDVYPQVKRDLIEPGRVRLVWRDFPLDQVALAAAVTARALPPERYEAFLGTLMASQDRWAYALGGSPVDEIGKLAALAGMPRDRFEAVQRDEGLRRAVLEMRLAGEREHRVQATPTFVFNGRVHGGNASYERFAQLVAEAR